MPGIRWILAALRRLILGNTLVRASIRGLLFLLSALIRATKKKPDPRSTLTRDSQNIRIVYPEAADSHGQNPYPALQANPENRAIYTSASFVPTSLHPYSNSGPSASRSSQEISAHPITQESYSLHSLSVQHLPTTLSVQQPPETLSVQHLPALPPSPNFGAAGYLPSKSSSAVDFHLPGPATESPIQSRHSSGVFGDVAVPSIPALLNEAHPRIFPGTPESLCRYDRRAVIPSEATQFTLDPLTISVLPVAPPTGWTRCQHPEGAPYFFHDEKRVFTDANLFDGATLKFMDENVRNVTDFLRVHSIQLAPDVDLVLDEYIYDDQSKGCQYYFVNHQDRCVFWLDKAQSEMFDVTQELRGMTDASHIRHELEAQYWCHCELYPRSFEVTHEIVDELRDILLHALGDLITSATSTVSWKVDDLNNMIKLVDGLTKNVGKNVDKKFTGTCLVGRLMKDFVRARVYNYHSTPGARLDIGHSVYGTVHKRTLLIKILSPLLFYAPDFHLLGLETIFSDGLIRNRGWSEFIMRLNNEWQEFTLYATVVLNANVAFLSIQSVDQGGPADSRSPAQISSYLSILTSIGSVIIGLLLAKQNRNQDRGTAPDAARFIYTRTHPTLGLETLAALYALPYSLLIWSMVSFLAAFSFMCFENSDLLTRSMVAVLWAAVAVLILWCIVTAWESSDWDWLRSLFCWPSVSCLPSINSCLRPAPDEDEDVDMDAAQDEAKSTVSRSEPKPARKRRWAWPLMSMTLRQGSLDSQRTVTNV
ncbi:hypothetical protein C8F04DRAFT_1090422 [Mycena alexandri]|uniref:Uncharacterized protein n=1 Tax=Mycena alexandri TaxID=1745969 RepID=A0AAD6T294_9AGAR|nr:hypothetical protein C8F04DRAFT_1090422 [Mycena alexandri]